MHPILFQFQLPFDIPLTGNTITVYTYGFLTALGLLMGYFLALYWVKNEEYDTYIVSDILFYSVISGYISARLLYVAVNWDYYHNNLLDILKIWEGGIVFYGGIITAIIVALIYIKNEEFPPLLIADLMVPSIPLAHSIGRVGCLMYGCCFGRLCTSGITFPKWSNMNGAPAYMEHLNTNLISAGTEVSLPVYPTQVISSVFLLCLTVFLLIYDKYIKKNEGETFFVYIILYSLFRFIIEYYRYYENEFYILENNVFWRRNTYF